MQKSLRPWRNVKQVAPGEKRMIEMVQGNIHVGKSNMWVVRYWFTRLHKVQRKHGAKISKAMVHSIIKYALKCHRDNFATYAFVMGGSGP